MINKKNYKNNLINLLLNCVNKKGRHNIAKTILSQSSVNISKINNNYSFNKLIEDIISNYTLYFRSNKKNNIYKNLYIDNYKCVSNIIKNILTSVTKHKKRVSFDFYFKKEIEKLLDTCIDLNFKENNIYYNKSNYNKFEPCEEIEKSHLKKNTIKSYYKHSSKFNNNINKVQDSTFLNYYLKKTI